jgi:chemotaxis response regulator CheB
MPRAVTEAGLASQTLPLSSVSSELMRYAAIGRRPMAIAVGAL